MSERIYTMLKRKAKILVDGLWIDVSFKDIKMGDKFKLFESDGEQVKDNSGEIEWVAACDPFYNSEGVLTITV